MAPPARHTKSQEWALSTTTERPQDQASEVEGVQTLGVLGRVDAPEHGGPVDTRRQGQLDDEPRANGVVVEVASGRARPTATRRTGGPPAPTRCRARRSRRYRRNLLITVDGAGASHGLVDHISTLNASPRRCTTASAGTCLAERERAAIGRVPKTAWEAVLDHDGDPRSPVEAGGVELTALLREHPGGDRLANWPADARVICRREKPHPGAQLSRFEAADGWRYQLLVTNTPTVSAQFLEARHRPQARVEGSAAPSRPGSGTCPPSRSTSTARGVKQRPSPPTCCAGYACSASTEHWCRRQANSEQGAADT